MDDTADDYLTELAMSYERVRGHDIKDRKIMFTWLCKLDELPLLRHAYGCWSFCEITDNDWDAFLHMAISNKSIPAIAILLEEAQRFDVTVPTISFYLDEIMLPQDGRSETKTCVYLLYRLVLMTANPMVACHKLLFLIRNRNLESGSGALQKLNVVDVRELPIPFDTFHKLNEIQKWWVLIRSIQHVIMQVSSLFREGIRYRVNACDLID